MTTKDDYTPEEWGRLLQAPVYVGFYVIMADPNLRGMIKELRALSKALESQLVPESARELVVSLVAEIREKSEGMKKLPGTEELSQGTPEEIRARVLDTLRGVTPLLENKAPSEEIAGFKKWLLSLALVVAEASKRGGFLGIGGVRVSEKEKAALAELDRVL
ncbi:hypothetical protein J2129_002271 [Methanofollis sp. W23]|uniref:hypothetical protein n=1 Tax=Methanofollis sp. W23 TaxID=2817849 RepID=UPI001AE1EB65|nr:hypothetical protein [Methanofollis sp. W23]MBP2146817.1 hypothetical protein [Methanofollis sp. W23]